MKVPRYLRLASRNTRLFPNSRCVVTRAYERNAARYIENSIEMPLLDVSFAV